MSDPATSNAAAPAAPVAASSVARKESRTGHGWRGSAAALLIAVAALAFAAWNWYDARAGAGALRQEIAKRLADADTQARESRIVAEQAREAMAAAQVKLGVLESRLAESQGQQAALQSLYQELSRNRDEWAYAEIEQSLFLASQQLALAGDVKAALIALQIADARLQRMDRPQLTALRKVLNADIERLKAAPRVDTVAISTRLDALIAQVDKLPLAMEVRPQAVEPPAAPGAGEKAAWTRFWRDIWAELRQLVRVQQVDKPDAVLLAPTQAFFLRENLKLRLLGARLALLARDASGYKGDLKAARDWLGRYYDTRNNNVAHALAMLRNLHDAEVGIETPAIGATLEAMRNLRTARERGRR